MQLLYKINLLTALKKSSKWIILIKIYLLNATSIISSIQIYSCVRLFFVYGYYYILNSITFLFSKQYYYPSPIVTFLTGFWLIFAYPLPYAGGRISFVVCVCKSIRLHCCWWISTFLEFHLWYCFPDGAPVCQLLCSTRRHIRILPGFDLQYSTTYKSFLV